MRITTIMITAAALVGSVDLAVSQCHAEDAYQVLRPTDKDMSCQDLAGEANSLNASILARQNAQASSAANKRVAGAVGGGLLKSAGHFGIARFGGAIPGMGGMFARAAAEQATNAAAEAVANNGQDQAAAAPPVTPEQQRMNHLLGLYKEKSC